MATTTAEPHKNQSKDQFSSGSLEFVEKPRTTTVSVDDSETWVESKRFTVYKVVVQIQGRAYFIFRRLVDRQNCLLHEFLSVWFCFEILLSLFLTRYNDFHELFEKLKKKFPEANSLKLPGKRFIGNNFDPSFIQSRKERLHRFVLDMVKVRTTE